MVALNTYSGLDRLVHRIAFANPDVQVAAARIEDVIFKREINAVKSGPPIFITSLPRAGTTILLNALDSAPELATHVYRDMPFIMAPLLWSRLSGGFRRKATLRERAHGDGIAIGYDSAEAFEEVIWRAFWPDHYQPKSIALWSTDDIKVDAQRFLLEHFCKVIAARSKKAAASGRYLSKNNANIARLDLILRMFPDAIVLIPVRSPLAHAISLQRQHTNFLKLHADDPFVMRYMDDIGHYEFGALHRPIEFDGLVKVAAGLKPTDVDYWFAYWIAAFEHIAKRRQRVHLIQYERLCNQPREAVGELCELLALEDNRAPEIEKHFRPVLPVKPEFDTYRSSLRDRAEALHRELFGT